MNQNTLKKINMMVLRAQTGQKSGFNDIRDMFSFMERQIFDSFAKEIPFLKNKKIYIINCLYPYYWNILRQYKFDYKHGFAYYLKTELINGIYDIIKTNYGFTDKMLPSIDEIKKNIVKDPSNTYFRKKMSIWIRSLTPKQKQMFLMHWYLRFTLEECAAKTGLKRNAFQSRMKNIYNSFCKIRKKVKRGEKSVEYKEKIYTLHKTRIGW